MRGKHQRRRPAPGPITRSTLLVGVLALSLAVPRMAGEPTHRTPEPQAREAVSTAPSTEPKQPPGPPPAPAPARFTIAATGDILIHQALWERAAIVGSAHGHAFDFRPMFGRVRSILTGADLAICHLETPVSADDRHLSSYPVFSVPHEITDAIAYAGYDECSTASNHSLDGGMTGIRATLDALDRSHVSHAGTARTRAESRHITFVRANGVKVAHLSYAFGFNGFTRAHPWEANLIDARAILADARRARALGSRFTIVSLHWGVEGVVPPTPSQRDLAERLTASPAVDLILGHHAHVVQPVARVNGRVVAFGMGNFLSGMRPSTVWPEGVEDGVIVWLRVQLFGRSYRVVRVRTIPTTVEYGTWRILPA